MKVRGLVGTGVAVSLLTLGIYGAAAGGEDIPEKPATGDRAAVHDDAASAVRAIDDDAPALLTSASANGSSEERRRSPEDLTRAVAVSNVAGEIFNTWTQGSDSGYGTIHTRPYEGALTVFWVGTPPQELLDLAAKKPEGVDISFEPAVYSRAALDRGKAAVEKQGLYKRLDLQGVDPDVQSGFTIDTGRREPFTEAELDLLREATGVDAIKIQYGVPPVDGYSRDDDNAPWKGGGRLRLRTPAGDVHACTTAFAVIVGGTGHLLSAGHCDPETNDIYRDGAGNDIAPAGAAQRRPGIDSLLIDPTASPATDSLMYDGGWASNTKLTVKNWNANFVGDPVCSSGATLGTRCGTVYNDDKDITAFGYAVNVIYARAAAGQPLGGDGDSGAPFYKSVAGGVQARGVLLGGVQTEASMNCTGSPLGTVSCSRFISYVPISTILNKWSATLEVG